MAKKGAVLPRSRRAHLCPPRTGCPHGRQCDAHRRRRNIALRNCAHQRSTLQGREQTQPDRKQTPQPPASSRDVGEDDPNLQPGGGRKHKYLLLPTAKRPRSVAHTLQRPRALLRPPLAAMATPPSAAQSPHRPHPPLPQTLPNTSVTTSHARREPFCNESCAHSCSQTCTLPTTTPIHARNPPALLRQSHSTSNAQTSLLHSNPLPFTPLPSTLLPSTLPHSHAQADNLSSPQRKREPQLATESFRSPHSLHRCSVSKPCTARAPARSRLGAASHVDDLHPIISSIIHFIRCLVQNVESKER